MTQRLLVIGAGMAAAYLLRELAARDHGYDICVLGDERDVCYNRVLLSSALAGEVSARALGMVDDLATDVRFVSGKRVRSIDRARRQVSCDDGDTYGYDRLVLATGSQVPIGDPEWAEIEGVSVFRTLADTRRLRSLGDSVRQVVVLGGGLLGLEAAHGLVHLGYHTTVVHRHKHLMNRQLDARGSLELQRQLESRGIEFSLGRTISSVVQTNTADRPVCAVRLDNDDQLPCQLLLFATGIRPNTSVARAAGLECDQGVCIDDYMRSSDEHIYAIGECAQHDDQCVGLVAPIQRQATTLASVLCEPSPESYLSQDTPTQLKISGIEIFRAGALDEDAEQIVFSDARSGVYRRLVVRDNQLVGAVLVGDKSSGNWYSELIHSGANIEAIRRNLMFGSLAAHASSS
jgi:nitrite reductase (NADH) large subunit